MVELLLVGALVGAVVIAADKTMYLPGYFFHYDGNAGFLRAQGTWVIEGDSGGFPQQTSTLDCFKSKMRCIQATGIIRATRLMMPIMIEHIVIDRWDEDIIVFRETSAICTDYLYTVNLKAETIVGIRTLKAEKPAPCNDIIERPLRLRLTDGGRR